MNAFTYEGFSNVSSHSTTTTIDASGTTTTWSDTSSDQTYEYAAATVISGTSVGPGATTPVQFDHTWSTSGGITYPNGQTETWSNGATYTNPAQSGFILPAGLTVLLTIPGAAPSAALTAANNAQPPAGDLILLDSGTLPSGKTWELWGDDVNWYYKEYNANGELIEERSGPHSQSTYSALLVAQGISLEMQQQARTVYRNFLNSMTDLELSAWYNMSAEERQAAFHEWHWNKLKELTARIGNVQLWQRKAALLERVLAAPHSIRDTGWDPSRAAQLAADLDRLLNQIASEERILAVIRRELALNPPRTAEELGVVLEDPDAVFWSSLFADPNVQIAEGIVEAGAGFAVVLLAGSNPLGWVATAVAVISVYRGSESIGTGVAELVFGDELRTPLAQAVDQTTGDEETTDLVLFCFDMALLVADVATGLRSFLQARKLAALADDVGPKGGPYGKVRSANQGGQVHHTPAAKVTPYEYRKAPSVWMETADHQKTASWGRSKAAQAYRAKQDALINQGKLREAIQMDIDDIRSKFGNKYDANIRQMLETFGFSQ